MTRKRLWAPWRVSYISSMRKVESKSCLFCRKGRLRDGRGEREYILRRGRFSFSLLNRYPYNSGHLLIAPYRHLGRFELLNQEEWLEILDLANDAMSRLGKAMAPDGYNIGINLGRAAGAGIPGHLHLHIVPRWVGDTNFMPACADAKVLSQSLGSAYRMLKPAGVSGVKRRRR